MPATTSPQIRAKAALEQEFPGWRVVITDRSNWWAMRGPLPPDQMNERDTVEARSPEQLREVLKSLTALASDGPAPVARVDRRPDGDESGKSAKRLRSGRGRRRVGGRG